MKRILLAFFSLIFSLVSVFASMPLNVGVVLPLHSNDGDGLRAVEYYRGLILAAEELKQEGVEVNFFAWNIHIDADVNVILQDPNAKKCDIFFGPMYTKQVPAVQSYAERQGAKLIIPFSINESPAGRFRNVFQIYQEPEFFRTMMLKKFSEYFSNNQVVIIGCNDEQSTKGEYTAALKKHLLDTHLPYTITNLTTQDELFAKAFSRTKPNVMIINTAKTHSLGAVFKKLDTLKATYPEIMISTFGYTEWLLLDKQFEEQFHKYDMYIPTHSFYNPRAVETKNLIERYKSWFNGEMLDYNPRFGIMGYDHGMFFFRGFSKMGKDFKGVYPNNQALQSRIHFAQAGVNGGMQNIGFQFIHYNRNKTVSAISY